MSEATIRLKMLVNSVKKSVDSNGNPYAEEVHMSVVYGSEGSVNEKWSKWTPSGSLLFTISNPNAMNKLLPGQFHFVDLIPTDKDSL